MKHFTLRGKLKWFSTLESINGGSKMIIMLIPPNAGNFSKKVTFIEFFDDIAEKIFQTCTKDCFLNVQGYCKIYGNKIKFIGSDFQKLEFNTELGRYVQLA